MSPSPSDLFLSQDLTNEDAARYLHTLGFRDPAAAERNLRSMADDVAIRSMLGRMADTLLGALLRTPNPDAALVGFARYLAARPAKTSFLEQVHDDPFALQVLVNVLGTSPFLTEVLVRNPEYFPWLMAEIDRRGDRAYNEEFSAGPTSEDRAAPALDSVKRLKRRELLRIATRDILGRETMQSATAQLSDLAGWIIGRTLAIVARRLNQRDGRGRLPGRFAVIGLGKLGGRELNYSSDIDLLYVHDPDDQEDQRAHDVFRSLARELTAALGEHTDESYLYRVDLRLRPMGSRGAITYSLADYGRYYEEWGETFERFALIKARPIAGDIDLGGRFIDLIRPFVYRKYLDHAALEEIYRYKERADRALSDGETDRDVKRGRGGIREVELFTQVLQLTYGGQQPALRIPSTLAALDALRESGMISDPVWRDLTRAYAFLRMVEHRLQIVHERQTHSLSTEALELDVTARRLGLRSAEELQTELRSHRDRVHQIYSGLFERRPGTSHFPGRQFFRILNDEVSDEEAVAHLTTYGLRDPAGALEAVRTLEQHACPTHTRSTARNVLANLLDVWMPRIAGARRPEAVLNRFERLSGQTGGARLLYRTLLEDDAVRDRLLNVLDSGDLLSERLIRHPELLDSLFPLPVDVDSLNHSFTASLGSLRRTERMNQVRHFKLLTEFKILVEWLGGSALGEVQDKLSHLADCCVEHAAHWGTVAVPIVGRPDDVEWAIVALGRLGGRELGVHSDLDLVVLYDGDPADSPTFVRFVSFVEEVQAFLEHPTSEGVAYRVDTRLRPEGTKGALAMPLAGLRRYLESRAEPWERLAWTRCRVVVGTRRITQELPAIVERFVYGPWDPKIVPYMRRVRMRMERELAHESETRVNFKVGRGGLADIDFVLQLVQIREGAYRTAFRTPGTRALLASLPATTYLTPDEVVCFLEAYTFLVQLEMRTRMEANSNVSLIEPGAELLAKYPEITEQVRSIYETALTRIEESA